MIVLIGVLVAVYSAACAAADPTDADGTVTAHIEAENGGTLENRDGVALVVPPRVLEHDATAKIAPLADGAYDISLSGSWHGLVQVRLPIPRDEDADTFHLLIHEIDGDWTAEDADANDGALVANVDELSVFKALKCVFNGHPYAIVACLVAAGVKSLPESLVKKVFGEKIAQELLDLCYNPLSLVDVVFLSDCKVGAPATPHEAPTTATPPAPKPTLTNLAVAVVGPGRVTVSFDVAWQSGRDPMTCHFFIDGKEVFTAQCGTSSSKQFTGLSPGQHSFSAIVTDRYGVSSDPSPVVVRDVPGQASTPTTQAPPPPPPPPAAPKPKISNFTVVVHTDPGHVGVAYDVAWQSGRDPVTCHFFIDGKEVFTAQCGTHSSKQFYGISPGQHSFYATVSDRYGVYSDPSPTIVRSVPGTPPSGPDIKLSKGAAAPSGFWYSVALSGFSPGSSVTVTCRDSVDPGGFWTQTFTIGGDGRASDTTLCYSADGPDHWVTGGGIESNHVGW